MDQAKFEELKRHVVDLEFIKTTFDNVKVPNQLFPVTEDVPVPILVTEAQQDDDLSNTAPVQIMYLPTAAIMDETKLLQFYAPIPEVDISSADSKVSSSTLALLNQVAPLGCFSPDSENKLFYRYVQSSPLYEVPNEKVLLEVYSLFAAVLLEYKHILLQLQNGEITDEDLLTALAS